MDFGIGGIIMSLDLERISSGVVATLVATPIIQDTKVLVLCVFLFELVDFITGCWKSSVIAHKSHKKFAFESIKAWRTIYKTILILVGIYLTYLLDYEVLTMKELYLPNYFCAFVCGVEFWSFLENAAQISDHPLFRWLRKFMKTKVEEGLDTNFDEITREEK